MEVSQDHYWDQNHSDFTATILALWKRGELHTYRLCAHSSVFSLTHPEKWLYKLTVRNLKDGQNLQTTWYNSWIWKWYKYVMRGRIILHFYRFSDSPNPFLLYNCAVYFILLYFTSHEWPLEALFQLC